MEYPCHTIYEERIWQSFKETTAWVRFSPLPLKPKSLQKFTMTNFNELNNLLGKISESFQNAEISIVELERMKKRVMDENDIIGVKNLCLILIDFTEGVIINLVKYQKNTKKIIEEKIKRGR